MSAIVPIPTIPISVRPGTMEDLAFIDGLQKKNTKQVGFMPEKALEGKVRLGHVLVAEEGKVDSGELIVDSAPSAPSLSTTHHQLSTSSPVGYLIGNDQYFKRDDVGAIFQINIVEGKRRALVGATLLKAQFDRSAYGCKLYCCWCAQDLPANYFWESMGFVPLAFRAGSAKKARVHIFWQKRIRQGDETTPWWFPSQTTGGSIRADRLVFPIPPGKNWWDEMPRILPAGELPVASKQLPVKGEKKRPSLATGNSKLATTPQSLGGWSFTPPPAPKAEKPAKAPRAKRKVVKNDPKLVAAARELRDRWLEKVNEDPSYLLSNAKYEVAKVLAPPATNLVATLQSLPAPIAA